MAGLFLPTEGSLSIRGELVTKKNLVKARSNVGLLFQDPDDQIFMPTVWDDVAFGPINIGLDQATVEERVAEAIEMAGIQGYEQRVPHHLSFGEKKRVAIAGVLAMKPSILLLDEPTANLDPQGRRDLMEILDSLEATQVFATHDFSVAYELTAQAVLLMRSIIFQGTFRELVEKPDILKQANLELPPPSRVMAEWRSKQGKDFEIP
jgi:cobalt/nickel transport system ATP-binding protein